ncbi:hypothetical protein BKA62DRAFT_770399 [Auriculariales sp. MPI-PUGE-AT-0066]|nr:hypothetical protein BKA62DRAFT_770399 [Auriculariales sp. MPI-PUGE-AT-0066]
MHMPSRETITTLPTELVELVLDELDRTDVITLAHVCSRLRAIATRDSRFFFECRLDSSSDEPLNFGREQLEFCVQLMEMVTFGVPISLNLSLHGTEPDSIAGLVGWSSTTQVVDLAIQNGIVVEFEVVAPAWMVTLLLEGCTSRAPFLGRFELYVDAEFDVTIDEVERLPLNIFGGHAPRLDVVRLRSAAALPEEPIPAFANVTDVTVTPASMEFMENIGTSFPRMESLWIDAGERLDYEVDPWLPGLTSSSLRSLSMVELFINPDSIQFLAELGPNVETLSFLLGDLDFSSDSCVNHIPLLLRQVLPHKRPVILSIHDHMIVCSSIRHDGRLITVRFERGSFMDARHFTELADTVATAVASSARVLTLDFSVVDQVPSIVAKLPRLRKIKVAINSPHRQRAKVRVSRESIADWTTRHSEARSSHSGSVHQHNNSRKQDRLTLSLVSRGTRVKTVPNEFPVTLAAVLGVQSMDRVAVELSGICFDSDSMITT